MKLSIRDATNKEAGSITAPVQFSEEYRPDLIVRAVLSLQSRARTPYGAKPGAGLRASAELSRRRRKYRGSYGFGISRVPRKILSRRGTRMYWVGAVAPGMVGGRRAHPPKAEKEWAQKINKTENRKAIRSAMSATMDRALVMARGHKAPKEYPFIVSSDFEKVDKTRDIIAALAKLGLGEELERSEQKNVRAGKGTLRGRRYKKKKGPLFVVSKEDVKLLVTARNIPGVDVCVVDKLNVELLAPGTHAGRITLFTEAAVKRLADEKLFTKNHKGSTQKKEKPVKPTEKKTKPAKKPTSVKKESVKKTPVKAEKKE